MTETTTRTETTTTETHLPDDLEEAIGELRNIGRTWAVHGLEAGRSALEASATTLKSTARFLEKVSTYVDERLSEPAPEHARQTPEQ